MSEERGPRLVVVGARGQVGRHLVEAAQRERAWEVRPLARTALDLEALGQRHAEDPAAAAAALDSHPALEDLGPSDVVALLAADTAVDDAESHAARARAVNTEAPGALAQAAARRGAAMIFVSTDYVFDNRSDDSMPPRERRPWRESDPVGGPRSVYGATKAAGERAVRAAHPAAVVVRTSWVYTGPARREWGDDRSDFVTTMLRLAGAFAPDAGSLADASSSSLDDPNHSHTSAPPKRLRVVDDQVGTPTWAPDLAEGLLDVATRLSSHARTVESSVAPATSTASSAPETSATTGDLALAELGSDRTLHLAGVGTATWRDLAEAAVRAAGLHDVVVEPCTTADFPRPAPRPAWSPLDTTRARELGIAGLRSWRAAVNHSCGGAGYPESDE